MGETEIIVIGGLVLGGSVYQGLRKAFTPYQKTGSRKGKKQVHRRARANLPMGCRKRFIKEEGA